MEVTNGDIDLIKTEGGTVTVIWCHKNIDSGDYGIYSLYALSHEVLPSLGNQWATDEVGTLFVKPSTETVYLPIEDPMFTEVPFSSIITPVTTNYADFVGITSPVSLNVGDKSNLFLGANNTLYYPNGSTATEYYEDYTKYVIKAFRAYFKLKNIDFNGLSATRLNFGEEEATGIINVQRSTLNVQRDDAWFTLDGLKLQGKPTKHGLYIHNGRKVVVK